MKDNRLQVILPDALVEKFVKEAEKQKRSHSNLARLYIVDGLLKDQCKKSFSDIEMDSILTGVGVKATLKGIGE